MEKSTALPRPPPASSTAESSGISVGVPVGPITTTGSPGWTASFKIKGDGSTSVFGGGASYDDGKVQFQATGYRLRDTTAAMAAFQWLRPAGWRTSDITDLAATNGPNTRTEARMVLTRS